MVPVVSWKDPSGCIAGARMEEMRVQEMLCEAGTLNQVVWPGGWRVNRLQTGARERTQPS